MGTQEMKDQAAEEKRKAAKEEREKEEAQNWCSERSNLECSLGVGANKCVLGGIPTSCGRLLAFKKVTQEMKDQAAEEKRKAAQEKREKEEAQNWCNERADLQCS